MLKRLTLEDFKGLRKAQIDCGRITVLIGPNGTGKSSISQILLLLRQSIGQNELITNGPVINLGNFNDVLNEDSLDKKIKVGLTVEVGKCPSLGINENASYIYNAGLDPKLTNFDVKLEGPGKKYLIGEYNPSTGTAYVNPYEIIISDVKDGIKLNLALQPEIALPLKVSGMHHSKELESKALVYHQEATLCLQSILTMLTKVYYVPPIRGLMAPSHNLQDNPSRDLLPGHDAEFSSTFVYADSATKETVSRWAQDITGSDISPTVIPGRKVLIQSFVVSKGIPVCVDGFGTNQLLQLLLTLATAPRESLIGIEEPEIHLYPKAQTKLCDILVEEAKKEAKQVILSTHSEHILWGFVSAVRGGALSKDELSIYYFKEKGTEPYRVEQDECGDIYGWGEKFF
jgi:energy-coupling factor transporter ATP-binding protein EcfA2